MLPPGMSFNALSPKALHAKQVCEASPAFWSWDEIVAMNARRLLPLHANTNLLYGLVEALDMLLGEGCLKVFARHQRWAAGVRAAVQAWGLPIQCADPQSQYSPVLTG
jgi:alanine-glyoxylate transaminase / serine-glyoxylate transaminase / serine-pyruvate transaminase